MDDPLLHCVWFRRGADAADKDVFGIYVELERLVDQMPGASDFRAGENVSPEGFDHGCKDGFMIRFDSAAARDAYLVNETHQKIGTRLVELTEGGTDGLVVFDLPL